MDRPGHFEQFPDAVKLVNASNFEQANVIAAIALILIVLPNGTGPNHASEFIAHAEKKPESVAVVDNSSGSHLYK